VAFEVGAALFGETLSLEIIEHATVQKHVLPAN
jgi:hypothetical protein